ncbi:MAG: SDR family oxidoreductase [Deltaproteobacteria bacterium]|nr:SDR family oxidoreductase [Deltaproteobacteria bacterium]
MNFKNQFILITGASSGIGKRLAIDLAARGAVIIACARSPDRLEAALTEIRRTSPRSTAIRCDVGSRDQARAMVGKVLGDFGAIDILINNAGVGMRKPFVETPLDTLEQIMRTNYLGAVYCTHAVLPSMIARGRGHIVNISSVAGHIGTLNMAGYCASKFALNGFSESLYHELKPRGIHVSLVCPGPVKTDFNRSFADTTPKSPKSMTISPESVSKTVIRAIEKNRFEVITPRSLALICAFKRFMPGLFRALCQRAFRSHVSRRDKHVP